MSTGFLERIGLALKTDAAAKPSERGQARLLDMTHARLVFGVSAIPFVAMPFLVWFYLLGNDARLLLVWTLGYTAAAIFVRLRARAYERDRSQLADGAMIAKWLPIVHRTALLHGAGLAMSMLITAGHASLEFALLLLISLAAIVAANATHQTPVLSSFQRFLFACWGTCCVLLPWTLPGQWPYALPLALIYVISIYRNALTAHQFFVQQVKLEEEGGRLAESYRLAKEEAEQALRSKNQFLTTASHDLRQPVHAMGFLIESIAHRNRDVTLAPALEDLRRSVRSVHTMFNSLLDLTKIESGVVMVNPTTVSLDALMDEVVTLFREEARSRGLTLRARRTRGHASVWADASLLKQSLVNLVHNALRYTPRGGILLAGRRRGTDWQIEVWDTGMGVADDDQTRIYSPFYRPELAWRVDSAGHGLGLAVVARCANLMGARYGLTSKEGRGSRFWIRVPEAPATQQLPRPPASPGTPVSRAALGTLSGTCLVIDDDPQVSAAWKSLMTAWGVQVCCVASASEAFAALDTGFHPQAVLCDQRLRSGESGFDVLKELFVRCPDASGAMVSGEFDSPELQQAEREGYLVLHKPLEVAQLHALLSRWLGAAHIAQ